jgi:predicted transcriptional regulator
MPFWTLLTNYGLVLELIYHLPEITATEIARIAGISERSVRTILKNLETEGYIVKYKRGRSNWYVVNTQQSMRHPYNRDIAVGELLQVFARKRPENYTNEL